ncbi:MAG TPA: response regulator [Polyangiaceae bacterium]|jgi:CheY-like chemotaxis protein|nr:response regulator [Polyangiaceae bacterium]
MAIDPVTGQLRPKILVVEDEPDLLQMIKTMLQSVGEVTLARDGQEALDILKSGFRPNVIVTDLMMPRLDGLALAKMLKTDPNIGNVPLVILTAKAGPMDMITGINAGARHYVTKPFKAADLIDKVKKALMSTPNKRP